MNTQTEPQAGNSLQETERTGLEQVIAGGKKGEEITHKSVDYIAHKLGITPLERILFWLSKTDIYALANCTHHTRLTLSGLGLMVLFTMTLALVSGYTTLSVIIDPKIELRELVALAGASLYAFGIMLIDREIVGNPSHKALWIRLAFAFVIATAVSYPIKLKLLDGPIKAEISAMVDERNSEKLQRIDALRSRGLADKDAQMMAKDEQLAGIRTHMRELQAQIYDERTKKELGAKCDKRCEAAKAQLLVMQAQENKVIEEKDRLRGDDGLPANAQAEVKRLQAEVDEQKHPSDFLSYWQAQDRVMKRDQSGARVLSYFLFFFFLALELVPVGLKYALGTSEYHQYLEARHRLNLQKLASVTNMLLEYIQDATSLEEIMRLPPELTDLLCYLMEDSTMPFQLDAQFRKTFAAKMASQVNGKAFGGGTGSAGTVP
jgi:hypothetical protein